MMSRTPRCLLALLIPTFPSTALGYCRTLMEDGDHLQPYECREEGTPLEWEGNCIPMGIHYESFEAGGVSREKARAAFRGAMNAWMDVDCGAGARPSLEFNDRGEMHCDLVEYLKDAELSNNNIVLLRKEWQLAREVPALTTLTYSVADARILDSDIELMDAFAEADGGAAVDLETVLTHELGHVIGLAHSDVENSLMNESYDTGPRQQELSPDDVAAVCALFPPGEGAECPAEVEGRDFTRECATPAELEGCSVRRPTERGERSPWITLGLFVAFAARLLARRRARG
jgi:hypothetical protein